MAFVFTIEIEDWDMRKILDGRKCGHLPELAIQSIIDDILGNYTSSDVKVIMVREGEMVPK